MSNSEVRLPLTWQNQQKFFNRDCSICTFSFKYSGSESLAKLDNPPLSNQEAMEPENGVYPLLSFDSLEPHVPYEHGHFRGTNLPRFPVPVGHAFGTAASCLQVIIAGVQLWNIPFFRLSASLYGLWLNKNHNC